MIFADKLMDLRKKNGWSQEELAERLEVSRQTISKWEGAQSVPDLSRMLKLSELFGVTTDYLIKDDLEPETLPAGEAVETEAVSVTMEQAAEFLRLREIQAGRTALGAALCILSPAALILLAGAQELRKIAMTEEMAAGLGCLVLFLLVAAAVGIFVSSGFRMRDYEIWEQQPLDTAYGVEGMVRDRMGKYAPIHSRKLVAGIGLCVLCPVPLFAAMSFWGEADWPMLAATALLLVLVALGVSQLVSGGIRWDSFAILLETGSYTRLRKEENRRNGLPAAIYWGLVIALYLGWSFATWAWDKTWAIWPVAAVLYGVLEAVLRLLRSR